MIVRPTIDSNESGLVANRVGSPREALVRPVIQMTGDDQIKDSTIFFDDTHDYGPSLLGALLGASLDEPRITFVGRRERQLTSQLFITVGGRNIDFG